MKVITIAYYTILRNIRDRKSLANMLLMPIILVLILGNALGSAFEINKLDRTNIAYLNMDNGQISSEFDKFLNNDEIKELLNVANVSSYEEGIEMVKGGKVSGFIMIDSGYSSKIEKGEKAAIDVYSDTENSFRASLVKNIVDSFTNAANTYMASIKLGNTKVVYDRKQMLEEMSVSAKGKVPKAMDYYAVTMLVMIIMYGAQYGLHGVSEDYIDNMRIRLGSTPVRLSTHFTGKILGMTVTVFVQAFILILFTKYAYGANWGSNVPTVLFIIFSLVVFSITTGVMVAITARDKNVGTAVISTVIPVMTFISGGYVNIISDNKTYNAIKLLLPSNLGQTALFGTIYGNNSSQTYFSITALWIITGLIGIIAVMAGRRKFE